MRVGLQIHPIYITPRRSLMFDIPEKQLSNGAALKPPKCFAFHVNLRPPQGRGLRAVEYQWHLNLISPPILKDKRAFTVHTLFTKDARMYILAFYKKLAQN